MGTRHYVEQRLAKRRVQEAKDMDLRRKIAETNIIAGYAKSDNRVEDMRRLRTDASERHELFTDYHFTRAEQDKARRTQIAQFEEHLADELARRKAEQQRKDIDKMRICEASEELRTLKSNLHMAKVNKERAQQLLDQEVRKEHSRQHEEKMDEMMLNQRLQHIELEHKLEFEKLKQRERVKTINQQQIAMKEAQREEAMQEYLKEQAQVKELVEKIANEDHQEMVAKEQKKEEARIVMERFKEDVRQQQMEAIRKDKAEQDRIEEFARKKREFEDKLEQERQEAEREKNRRLVSMIGDMEAQTKAAEELEQLRNDMHMEELEAAARRREEAARVKAMEARKDMHAAYNYQMQLREAQMQAEKEEEEKIKQQMLKKFAEDDRIEQLNDAKRRMKVQEHKREADRLIKLKREQFEAARRAEMESEEKLREEEKVRQAIVEDERRRLIKEHAQGLQDFLPKGTLEHPEDLHL